VIGLTIVAVGTSTPELVVSLNAAWRDQADLSLGNVVGSNLANIGLILGVCGLLRPLPVALRLLRMEMPALVATTLVFAALCLDHTLGRGDGALLCLGLLLLTLMNLRGARREGPEVVREFDAVFTNDHGVVGDCLWVVGGLVALITGGHLLVSAATAIARAFGVSELIIGLTLVAVGTSLPELATSLVAVVRNEMDIAVGDVVGSNLFNILGVAGPTALVRPLGVNDHLLALQLPCLVAITVALWALLHTGHTLQRWEAAGLLILYAATMVASAGLPGLLAG